MPAHVRAVAQREGAAVQIEAAALGQEKSADAKERLDDLKREIAEREEKVNVLKTRWQTEKEAISGLKPLQEKIDQLRMEYDPAPPFAAGSPDTAPAAIVAAMKERVAPAQARRLELVRKAVQRQG